MTDKSMVSPPGPELGDEQDDDRQDQDLLPDSSAVPGQWRDYLATHERRRRLVPRAIVVGLIAGIVALAFRRALLAADDARDALFDFGHSLPWYGILIPMAFSAVLAGLAVWIVRRWAPEAGGSGIPQVEAVLHRLHEMRWKRILPVKFIGGFLCINSGMALGREGPTIQMGAAVGQMVDGWFNSTPRERRSLIAAGAAAGLSAAFNAPLAGLVFVIEELQRDFSTGVFTAAFMSALTADFVTRAVTGQSPIFRVNTGEAPSLEAVPAFLAIGALCGLLGVAYNRSLLYSLDFFERRRRWPSAWKGAAVGLGIGLIGWFLPSALGDGHRLVETALGEAWPLGALVAMFLVRFVMTVASYGCGAPGGIFAPLLVLGAEAGLAVGTITLALFPKVGCSLSTFAVVGMAAYFAAIVRAPLTGIVLITELTGNFTLMLALLSACLVAYGVANFLGDKPIYEALMHRDLRRNSEAPRLTEPLLLEMSVHHGAAFEGKCLADLGLPPGCIVVTVRRAGEEMIPDGSTVLQAGDWLTVVLAPQAAHAAAVMREGTDCGPASRMPTPRGMQDGPVADDSQGVSPVVPPPSQGTS